ncbi:hypothetical protein [Actomonas aquatica]|uniref:DUF4136 domain-containing protein n=1 Tax=Actomonas aquatica TaxID=2866162 RepID=A0ABZ1C4U2_9BACT|nr:hypothetical protein [Opitutus sp. WL0086]WRQ86491.1 hypothetical protein K1X11_016870 [Opitutus sp. WL0086]
MPHPTPRVQPLLLALTGIAFLLAGCETTTSHTASSLTVQAARAPRMATTDTPTPAATEPRTYTLRYVNAKSRDLIQPDLSALFATLARQGFTPAVADASPDAIVWIAAITDLHQEQQVGSLEGPPAADNPDSLRYKNAAGMIGRYNRLMHDDRHGSGEMILGPEGEVIMTGNLGDNVTDEARFDSNIPQRTVLRQRNVLALWATRTTSPAHADDDGELWLVEAMSDQPAGDPPTPFPVLVDLALQNLGTDTHGPQTVPLPEPTTP